MKLSSIRWYHRDHTLNPNGILVYNDQRPALIKRLLSMPDKQLSTMRGSYNDQVIILMASTEDLPWVGGSCYIGQDANAKHLWLPTNLSPSVSADLLDNAVVRKFGSGQYALDPINKQCYCITESLTVSRTTLLELA